MDYLQELFHLVCRKWYQAGRHLTADCVCLDFFSALGVILRFVSTQFYLMYFTESSVFHFGPLRYVSHYSSADLLLALFEPT